MKTSYRATVVIAVRFVPKRMACLAPTNIKVFAANMTSIPVLNTILVCFEVMDTPVQCRFLVSGAVDNPMLGIDWPEANECHWDFLHGTFIVAAREVPLVSRPR